MISNEYECEKRSISNEMDFINAVIAHEKPTERNIYNRLKQLKNRLDLLEHIEILDEIEYNQIIRTMRLRNKYLIDYFELLGDTIRMENENYIIEDEELENDTEQYAEPLEEKFQLCLANVDIPEKLERHNISIERIMKDIADKYTFIF